MKSNLIVVRTPLRVSLFGGGSDFPEYFRVYGGQTIGFTINKYVHLIIRYRDSEQSRYQLSYSSIEDVGDLHDIRHPVIREVFSKYGINGHIQLSVMSDLPAYSGLGSSSAFTVGLLGGIGELIGNGYSSPLELAKDAIEIERGVLKESGGWQDQIITAVGGFQRLSFHQDGTFTASALELDINRKSHILNNLHMCFLGGRRNSYDIEEKKKANMCNNIDLFHRIHELCESGYHSFVKGSIDDIGALLNQSWMNKRELAVGVTNDKIDHVYQVGIEGGATGGKLLGAGAGGYILFYVPSKNRERFLAHMCNYTLIDFDATNGGYEMVHNG